MVRARERQRHQEDDAKDGVTVLEKNEDGIIEPVRVEVQLREGRKGLGAEVESSQKS